VGVGEVKAGRRAVFLDRDGVLNRAIVRDGKPYPPRTLDEFELVEDAREQLARLKELGYMLIVVTNQPDLKRNGYSRELLDTIHARLQASLPLDDIRVCLHDNEDQCECRKPKPGLLVEAAKDHGVDLAQSFMIGDRWRDVDAGAAAGCASIWIDCNYDERGPAGKAIRVGSLREAVDVVVRQHA
jgi:D-glycero-D-manno-heptose 1,7-bisphosphate phosphatase